MKRKTSKLVIPRPNSLGQWTSFKSNFNRNCILRCKNWLATGKYQVGTYKDGSHMLNLKMRITAPKSLDTKQKSFSVVIGDGNPNQGKSEMIGCEWPMPGQGDKRCFNAVLDKTIKEAYLSKPSSKRIESSPETWVFKQKITAAKGKRMQIAVNRMFKQEVGSKFSSWKLGQHKKMFFIFNKGPYIPAFGKSDMLDINLELESSNKPTVDEMGIKP